MPAATPDAGVLGCATSYHLSSGGRGWRAELIAECGRALAVSSENCARLGAACELVHQDSVGRNRMLQLLARARRRGLGRDEAETHAMRLSPYVARLSAWAGGLLAEAVGGLDEHPLAPVLIAAAGDLGARMSLVFEVTEHAA